MDNAEHTGQTDEQYAGGHILINGLDIGPAIDAAVMETLVRVQNPERPSPSELVRIVKDLTATLRARHSRTVHPDWYDWLILSFLTTIGCSLLAVGLSLVFNTW